MLRVIKEDSASVSVNELAKELHRVGNRCVDIGLGAVDLIACLRDLLVLRHLILHLGEAE